jgi:hypothetical protein
MEALPPQYTGQEGRTESGSFLGGLWAKHMGLKWRCCWENLWGTHWEPWEHIENLMRTHWELEGNILGAKEK